jgi:hypothetical protein
VVLTGRCDCLGIDPPRNFEINRVSVGVLTQPLIVTCPIPQHALHSPVGNCKQPGSRARFMPELTQPARHHEKHFVHNIVGQILVAAQASCVAPHKRAMRSVQ